MNFQLNTKEFNTKSHNILFSLENDSITIKRKRWHFGLDMYITLDLSIDVQSVWFDESNFKEKLIEILNRCSELWGIQLIKESKNLKSA